ncbi:MAG TPA: hypothetical protein VIM29_00855 [Bacillota bacterium]
MKPNSCDCLAEQSEFNKNGSLKRLVINQSKAEGSWIFKAARIMEYWIIVNLSVAEGKLRREFSRIRFKRVDTD